MKEDQSSLTAKTVKRKTKPKATKLAAIDKIYGVEMWCWRTAQNGLHQATNEAVILVLGE